MIHNALDLGGMLLGVGFVFDTANSIYYFSEGDYLNGAMSAASAVPGIGDAFSAAKKGSKGLGIAAKVGKGAGKTVAKEAGEKVGKEVVEEATERLVKEGTEEVANRTLKESAEKSLKDCGTKLKCFTAGTKVSTAEGQKNIEEIKEGDYVLSKDPVTGKTGYKKVLKTFVSSKEKLIHIKVGETFIETTEGHPFWVVGYGFKYSHEIKVGDHVITAEGIEAEVTFVETVDVEPTKTYNFEVEDWHTYFVSDAKIWVHNDSGICDDLVEEVAEKNSDKVSRLNWGKEHGKGNIKHNNAIEDEIDVQSPHTRDFSRELGDIFFKSYFHLTNVHLHCTIHTYVNKKLYME